jgi:hypothetical protein
MTECVADDVADTISDDGLGDVKRDNAYMNIPSLDRWMSMMGSPRGF